MAAASAVGCLAGAVMLEVSCPGEDGSCLDKEHYRCYWQTRHQAEWLRTGNQSILRMSILSSSALLEGPRCILMLQ